MGGHPIISHIDCGLQELGSISARVLINQSVKACELGKLLLLGVLWYDGLIGLHCTSARDILSKIYFTEAFSEVSVPNIHTKKPISITIFREAEIRGVISDI